MAAHVTQQEEPRSSAEGRVHRRTIFLSYSRQDERLAAQISSDLNDMGVDVWRDERLSGGQAWWDTILSSIRGADAVLFVLSSESLTSVPCARELAYAEALHKPILPVRIDQTSPNLAPPFLAELEWVDYAPDVRAAVIRLMRAVNSLPPAGALPDPLPEAPEVPLSYTTNLAAMVHQAEELSAAEQHSLLFELREGLADPAHREECAQLLTQLRGRRELLASVARQVDEALAKHRAAPASGPSSWTPPPPAGSQPAPAAGPQQNGVPPAAPWPPRTGPAPGPPPWQPVRPAPQRARRPRRLGWVVAAFVAGLLILPAILIIFALAMSEPTPPSEPTLDDLFFSCQAGDLLACDDLYDSSPYGSDYENFGNFCGGRATEPQYGNCGG